MDLVVPSAGGFFAWLVEASWQAAVLVVLILITQRIFRERLSATWRFNLWLLVVLKLLLPVSPQTSFSLFNLFQFRTSIGHSQSATIAKAIAPPEITAPPDQSAAVMSETTVSAEPWARLRPVTSTSASRWTLANTLALLWGLGVLALSLPVAIQMWRLRWRIGRQRQVTDNAALELLEDCKELMNVRVPLVVVESSEVKSPVLYGFIRPRLVLPEGLIPNFGREELRFIFLHELAHLKRADIFVNWIVTALQILHWFNPLIWIALARMRGDRELACDHLALRHMRNEEVQSYGETVIKLLEAFARPTPFPGLVGILEEQSFIRRRIIAIAQFQRAPHGSFSALTVGTVLGLITLTDAKTPDRTAGRGSASASPGAWELRSSAPRDFARVSYSAVWSGSEMLIWGGGSNGRYFADGARYAPTTDSWQPISTNGSPSARWFHAGVWTGREMIVWGGRNRFDVALSNRNDGARYDSSLDRWRPMNHANAPAPRSQMAAVWTGSELIVWGGVGAGGRPAAGGGRYNLARDEWRPLPETGAPDPRVEPAYVWTGKEFIVWGGVSYVEGERSFRSGGRFDPAAKAWRPISLSGAPPDATGMNAIWTGTEMIVWGGRRVPGNIGVAEGAIYNPATDTWRPMSSRGAPRPRSLHTVVWTGDAMVIWGGMGAEEPTHPEVILNTGGIYDAARDEWTAMTTRAPEMRHFGRHDIGIWTGEGMLIFGGSNVRIELHSMHYWRPGEFEDGGKLADAR